MRQLCLWYCTTAQDGARSERKSQKPTENENKKAETKGKPMEQGSLEDGKVGVGEAQKLGYTSGRFQRPRCH